MDDILRFGVTVAIYFVIFAVVGIIFHAADKRFKAWLQRRARPTAAPANGRRRRRG